MRRHREHHLPPASTVPTTTVTILTPDNQTSNAPATNPHDAVAASRSGAHAARGACQYQHDRSILASVVVTTAQPGNLVPVSDSSPCSSSSSVAVAVAVAEKDGKESCAEGRVEQQSVMHVVGVADGHGAADSGHLVSTLLSAELVSVFDDHGVFHAPPSADKHPSSSDSSSADPDDSPAARIRAAVLALDALANRACGAARLFVGSTLCVALHHATHNRLTLVNVGDSRALLVTSSGSIRALTSDHVGTVAKERKRIAANGGVLVGETSLLGYISMTRGIGDDDLKAFRNNTAFPVHGPGSRTKGGQGYGEGLFVADPDVCEVELNQHGEQGREKDVAVVVLSDGITGVLSNQTIANAVAAMWRDGASAEKAAKNVVDRAMRRLGTDNATAAVHWLADPSGGDAGGSAEKGKKIMALMKKAKGANGRWSLAARRKTDNVKSNGSSNNDTSGGRSGGAGRRRAGGLKNNSNTGAG